MIDIRLLREDPEKVKQNCRRRGCKIDIDSLLRDDQEYLDLTREIEQLRAERNQLSKESRDNPEVREKVRDLKQTIAGKEKRQSELKGEINRRMQRLPNFLDDNVPDGLGDEDNLCLRCEGEVRQFDFEPKPHDIIGENLGIIDTARGAKVAQSGFYYWVGRGAQLASALFFWAQQELIKRDFQLFITPCLAKERTLYGTGYLPFFKDQTYELENEDLALIGTSEQTLVGFHADEVLEADLLPRRYVAFSPCFRTESGSYGKETRGIFRVHQFHKVEQIIFCRPEESENWHWHCQENEEYLMKQLGLPYRLMNICVGDLGAPGFKKYDIEAWFPGYGGYREVTSNTNLTDFQARRLNIRFQAEPGRREFVHTISATAVTDRVVCALLENYQQADGSVTVPEALRPFTGFDKISNI